MIIKSKKGVKVINKNINKKFNSIKEAYEYQELYMENDINMNKYLENKIKNQLEDK